MSKYKCLFLLICLITAYVQCNIRIKQRGVNLNLSAIPPQYLSDYNFFVGNMAEMIPNAQVIRYKIKNYQFSLSARCNNYIYIPEGKKTSYIDTGLLQLPVGSCLIKNLYIPNDLENVDLDQTLIETQLLILSDAGWEAYSYVWNEEQKDAVLVTESEIKNVNLFSHSGGRLNASLFSNISSSCRSCHFVDNKISPIGLKVRNLNLEVQWDGSSQNQLEYWASKGILTGLTCPATKPSIISYTDTLSNTIEERARAYLDINCAHCHNAKTQNAKLAFDFSYENQDLRNLGIIEALKYFKSLDLKNIEKVHTNKLGFKAPIIDVFDKAGLNLIKNWITSIDTNRIN